METAEPQALLTMALPIASAAELLVLLLALLLLYRPVGKLIYAAMTGTAPRLLRPLRSVELILLMLAGNRAHTAMTPRRYLTAVLSLSLLSFAAVFAALLLQPLQPHQVPLRLDEAFNLAASYTTNTNWQAVTAERAIHPGVQTLILGVQHFISALVGLCVAFVLLRSLISRDIATVGNFWQDIVRSLVYVMLPLSIIYALLLGFEGVPQTLQTTASYKTLETAAPQTLPLGLVASMEATKQLGTNGGGFYAANAAHPLANPTPLSNFFGLLAMLLLPMALCHTVSLACRNNAQGSVLLAVQLIVLVGAISLAVAAESPPFIEGKEQRFSSAASAAWSIIATATGTGANTTSFETLQPLTTLLQLLLMQLGEIIFGGVGTGMAGLIAFALVSVFIAGLMVGRTPEFWGKKISVPEMRLLSLYILLPAVLTLGGAAVMLSIPLFTAQLASTGSAGFIELLYGITSVSQNNGSAWGGLAANIPPYNWAFGCIMLLARFGSMTLLLLLAEQLLRRRPAPASAGTLHTDDTTFAALLLGIMLLVGVLTYAPAAVLGPVALLSGGGL